MAYCKYCHDLEPVDEKCLYPSETEAAAFFARQGMYGKIVPAVAYDYSDEDDDEEIFLWLLYQEKELQSMLCMFDYDISKLNKSHFIFERLFRGDIIEHQRRAYQFIWKKDFGITLRRIAEFHHQADLERCLLSMGYKELTFYLCKAWLIGATKKFIGYCWKIYSEPQDEEENYAILTYPLFHADGEKMMSYPFNQINTEMVDFKELIRHDGEIWKQDKDPEGKIFIRQLKLNTNLFSSLKKQM